MYQQGYNLPQNQGQEQQIDWSSLNKINLINQK